jgi:hypothetical protein
MQSFMSLENRCSNIQRQDVDRVDLPVRRAAVLLRGTRGHAICIQTVVQKEYSL